MREEKKPPSARDHVVLLADDDLFIRTLLKRFLPETCYFIEVSSGEDVLKAYKEARPKIVFLDMHMPEQDGAQIVKDILECDPQAYVVMISADGSRENISSSVISGAKSFMMKPLDSKRIMQEYMKAIAA
ncbi:MAG: response regulator [Proteobacteria bacterium]|nr:response regulator [Pseudomonadota bacterium]